MIEVLEKINTPPARWSKSLMQMFRHCRSRELCRSSIRLEWLEPTLQFTDVVFICRSERASRRGVGSAGAIEGFALIEWSDRDADVPYLAMLFGRGVGKQLMDAMMGFLWRERANHIALNSVLSAVRFYKRYGFYFARKGFVHKDASLQRRVMVLFDEWQTQNDDDQLPELLERFKAELPGTYEPVDLTLHMVQRVIDPE